MLILKVLARLVLMLVAPILLLIPTIYAHINKLDRLPWGLNYIFGCEEDGWNGNGIDPNNPRQGWQEGQYGVWREESERLPDVKYQGWYADYLKEDWSKLWSVEQWWLSYWWCAFRNVAWNLRLTSFGIDIHHKNIELIYAYKHGSVCTYEWIDSQGNEYSFNRKRLFGNVYLEYGYEFYPYIFDETDPRYKRIHDHGYTREYKYKHRSIPSVRPRIIK